MDEPNDLTEGELNILVDGLSDEVAFNYVLVHLGLLAAVDDGPGPVRARAVDAAIASLQRLVDRGLLLVGRTRYVDGGPPGRLATYEHVPEDSADVWRRLREDSSSAVPDSLYWSCWCVNTPTGDELARRCLERADTQ